MNNVPQISEFGKILIFIIVGFIMVAFTLFLGRLLSPKRPNAEKLSSYECGEEPTGDAWLPFNPRFYVIALIFLLFDVEMVFIFPWATVFGKADLLTADARWGKMALAEMFVFMGILILGLVYAWRKGDLNWIKPEPAKPLTNTFIPLSVYEALNTEQSNYKAQAFTVNALPDAATNSATLNVTATPTAEPGKRPMFKPSFKKPGNES